MATLIPVLLAGGKTKRPRPLSKLCNPKQFLPLGDSNTTLLQQAARQALAVTNASNVIIIGSSEFEEETRKQLSQLNANLSQHLIFEPDAKQSAIATMVAALYALDHADDPILWIIPTDRLILNIPNLVESVNHITQSNIKQHHVLLGVTPTHADINYSYILTNEATGLDELYPVASYLEKPDEDILQPIYQQPNCFLFSGMFLSPASLLLDEYGETEPDTLQAIKMAYSNGVWKYGAYNLQASDYQSISSQSIGHSLLQISQNLLMQPISEAGFSDVGSWQGIWELSQQEGEDGDALERFLKKLANAQAA